MEGITPILHDCVIDLECMASIEDPGQNPAIVDIGIASATWYKIGDQLQRPIVRTDRFTINPEEYGNIHGRPGTWYRSFDVSPQCMLWWATQNTKVRESVFGGTCTLVEALRKLSTWLDGLSDNDPGKLCIWGKPLHYDLTALRNAYRKTDVFCPYTWRQERDLSTVAYEIGVTNDLGFISQADDRSEQKHNPEYDAQRDLGIVIAMRRTHGFGKR